MAEQRGAVAEVDRSDGKRVGAGIGLKHHPDKAERSADRKAIDVAASGDDDVMRLR